MHWVARVVGDLGRGAAGARFASGQKARLNRVFSQGDVDGFCGLTGDANPIHRARVGDPAPVVPGLLCASLIPAIFASRCPGAVYVSQNFNFREKVHVGDATTAEILVERVKNLRGKIVVDCATRVFAKSGDSSLTDAVAIEGTARVLLSPAGEYEKP
jgi:3-hydroxybutyryl-CoA dehydratase